MKLKLNILLLVLLSLPALACAQGTAFSYQGHMLENGVAANGGHDFIFSLFNAATAGGQIGPALPLNNTPVTNGQFNVTLDFLADVFTGNPLWLEISVRPAGVGQFTKMDVRVSLLPTPYATFTDGSQGVYTIDVPAPPADLRIIAVESSGADLLMSFTSVAGKNYAIQSRTDVTSGTWTHLPGASIPGVGGTVALTLTNALNQPQQFYRIKIVP